VRRRGVIRDGVPMIEAIIVAAVIPVLIAGFWWTLGAPSYLPGGIDDPARQDLARFDELGNALPPAGEDPPT
jgi:hypothetical protein